MGNNNSEKKAFVSMGKRVVIIGAAVLAIGMTTVAAAQDKGYFSQFFGGTPISLEVNKQDQAVIKSGIKMKVEESLSGGKSSLIIVSFEKEDGTTFTEGAAASSLELDVKRGASYLVEQKLTEDGKKLIAMFDIDTVSSLEGKSITVKADSIVATDTGEIIANGPFKTSFKAYDRSDKHDISVALKQQDEDVVLNTIYVSAIGVGFEGERIDGQSSYLPTIAPTVKVLTTDGQNIELFASSTSTTDVGFKWQYSLNEKGNRMFLDKSAIKSITINEQTINLD